MRNINLLTGILLFLAACGQPTKDRHSSIDLSNPHPDRPLPAKGVALPVKDLPESPVVIAGEDRLPSQLDDLDGDGRPDELFFQIDLPAGAARSVRIEAGERRPAAARTQAFLLRQPHPYDPDSIKKISGPYQSLTSYEAPENLAPHGYWLKFEGPTWENDLIGYRCYLDTRNRYDIFGKQTDQLVLDTVSLDYHEIKPWGSDILKVGPSLGIGSPAFWVGDSLVLFEQYASKRAEIVASGPLRSIFRIHFTGLLAGPDTVDLTVEHEMQAGHRWTEMRLTIHHSTQPGLLFATGIVQHPAAADWVTGKQGAIFYGYTFGPQSFHDEALGMSILAQAEYRPEPAENPVLDSHVVVLRPTGNRLVYRFLAAWEREPRKLATEAAFAAHIQQEAVAWEAEVLQ